MMRKEEYEAWRSMPITQEFFGRVRVIMDEENRAFLNGEMPCSSNDELFANYHSVIAANRLFNKITEFDYERLVGAPVEVESIMESEDE